MTQLLPSNYTFSREMNRSSSIEDKSHTAKIRVGNERRVGLTHPSQIKNDYFLPSGIINNRSENSSSQKVQNLRDEDPHGLEGFPQYWFVSIMMIPKNKR